MDRPLTVVLRCADEHVSRARYVLDTLFLARGIPVTYDRRPPESGPWLLYGDPGRDWAAMNRCMMLGYSPRAWECFATDQDSARADSWDGLPIVLLYEPERRPDHSTEYPFDIVANAFYFLSSWSERRSGRTSESRGLYADSVFCRLGVPQDVVDRYLERIMRDLEHLCGRLGTPAWTAGRWPGDTVYAVLLSHDVDFIPTGYGDIVVQGAKTLLRHLVRQRNPSDALRAGSGLLRALARGRDPYGCIPEIIAREKELGVRSSFQVAVGHRHPYDVNYYIEDDRIRDYLRTILENGFELCLHGSYYSTAEPPSYAEEVTLLSERLGRPRGSRQHFLSFDYDVLFRAQEQTGIRYDMSMGFPDRHGARAGFSYPYFPWCLDEDRPYNVLQVSLFLMDVTLRGYMDLGPADAWEVMETELEAARRKGAGFSVVWHPIVFGGARDPGYDTIYWQLISHVQSTGGLATDGRTINDFWRQRAKDYPSFSGLDR